MNDSLEANIVLALLGVAVCFGGYVFYGYVTSLYPM